MEVITLYTGKNGYELWKKGLPFLASSDYREADYMVTTPVYNIFEHQLIDDIECYDVVNMEGVFVELIMDLD